MSCGYGTNGFQCDQVYTLGGQVTEARAQEMFDLGKKIGLSDFNPTSVNWDVPIVWKSTSSGGIMSEGEAWGLMIGFGFGLTFLTMFITYMQRTFGGEKATSEQFNTAGRSVKIGLTGSVIVSQWTWAATLLQSSNVAWNYGVSGPFWYASGATIQILLFGILAIEIKRKAPKTHTFLEIIKVRWGTKAHMVFLVFGLLANLIVSAMLLLGGCSVYAAVAGVSVYASSFVIPLLTLLYTLMGGLKATFMAGYVHTCIIMVILIVFVTFVYCVEGPNACDDVNVPCTALGSANVVYERLAFMTALPKRVDTSLGLHQGPANLGGAQNRQGSYLTLMSGDGLSFGIINIIGNFGTVFVDQSYWQSAIAATPGAAHKGYMLGGLVWFTIPFALATALGLAGNALNVALTSDDAGKGLVPPAAAIALFGQSGGVLVMIQLTMAILSTGSAECIAVSSLISYDVYRTYFNPNATGPQILNMSRIFVCVWALVMAIASICLNEMDIGLGWVYNFMATALGSAVPPIALSIYNEKLDATFAVAAALIGAVSAISSWLIYAGSLGEISKATTGDLYAQLTGGVVALGVSSIVCGIGCLVKPQNFDFAELDAGIKLVAGDGGEESKVMGVVNDPTATPEGLLKAKAWVWKWGNISSFFLVVMWPMAFMPMGTFGKSTFQVWAGIALMWGWVGGTVIIGLPIYESFGDILTLASFGKYQKASTVETKEVDSTTVSASRAP